MVLYNIGIGVYLLLIRIASLFSEKARLWLKGRKGWQEDLKNRFSDKDKLIWLHCASLGEFEQGRPLIEMIKEREPATKILLTFFSPSGYEVRENYELADYVMYLPADTARTRISANEARGLVVSTPTLSALEAMVGRSPIHTI